MILNPIQDEPLRGCSRMGESKKAPLSKICHISPTFMKLGTVIPYLEKIKKIHKSHSLSSADISIFSPKINIF